VACPPNPSIKSRSADLRARLAAEQFNDGRATSKDKRTPRSPVPSPRAARCASGRQSRGGAFGRPRRDVSDDGRARRRWAVVLQRPDQLQQWLDCCKPSV
jgi:hypothetical protein